MYFVYILKIQKDDRYYIGQTEDLDKRLGMHNDGRVISTRNRTPFVLIRKEIFNSRGEARKRENYIKKLKGGNEFRKLIS